MYHYFYRITNGINGKFYYGVHSTDDLNDGYMGSGKLILKAIKKYGKENFTKDILKFFESREELSEYEKEFINKSLISDNNCYNLITGGLEPSGLIEYVRNHLMVCNINDPEHKIFPVKRDDPRILTGELVPAAKILYKGKITVRDKDGKCFMVDKNDPRYLSGELVINTKGKHLGKVSVKDKDGKYLMVDKNDPRYLSGELVGMTKGMIPARDNFGNTILVSKDDPRLKTGELKHNTVGFTTVKDKEGNIFQVSVNDPRLKSGELKSNRTGLKWINKDGVLKSIPPEKLQEYIDQGWNLGIGNTRKPRQKLKHK